MASSVPKTEILWCRSTICYHVKPSHTYTSHHLDVAQRRSDSLCRCEALGSHPQGWEGRGQGERRGKTEGIEGEEDKTTPSEPEPQSELKASTGNSVRPQLKVKLKRLHPRVMGLIPNAPVNKLLV